MNETKTMHTPGPWREYDRNDQGDVYLCGDGDGLAVAIVLQSSIPHIEGRTEANACLIAAAPELLEVVTKVRSLLAEHDLDEVHPLAIVNAIASMDDAIAKATSERAGA